MASNGGADETKQAVWNVPPRLAWFICREDLLDGLTRRLAEQETAAVCAVHGLAGVGKTSLAVEYAYRHSGEFDVVWWVPAQDPALVGVHVASLGLELGLPAGAGWPAVAATLRRERRRWLLILDNVDDAELVGSFRPSDPCGRLLVTSRLAGLDGVGSTLEVPEFTIDEAVSLLARRVGGIGTAVAERIVNLLGRMPLAVEQAAGYLAQTEMPPAKYAALLRNRLGELLNRGLVIDRHYVTVANLWDLSMPRLRAERPVAAALLELSACCGPDPIPLDLITGGADELPDGPLRHAVVEDVPEWVDAVEALAGYSLARREGQTLTVHPLTAAATRVGLSPANRTATTALLVRLLVSALPDDIDDPAGWPRWRQLLPHVRAVLDGDDDRSDDDTNRRKARLCDRVGGYLHHHGLPDLAILYLRRSLALDETRHGSDDPDTLTCRDNLVNAYEAVGRAGQAIGRFEQVVAGRQRVPGAADRDTLASRHNLASACYKAGRVGEAIGLFEQVLADCERVLGADHPYALTVRHNLASAYETAGRVGEAIRLHEQVLADRQRVLGADHPDTLTSGHTLGGTYYAAARFGDAIRLFEQVVADCERAIGLDHPDTLLSCHDLAAVYAVVGRVDEAIRLYEQVLADRQRVLGADHPATLTSRNNLAYIYGEVGRVDEAIRLNEQVLADRRRVLGADHPDTLISGHNLGGAYYATGRVDEAIRLLEQVLADSERALGADHNVTRTVRASLDECRRRPRSDVPAMSLAEGQKLIVRAGAVLALAYAGWAIQSYATGSLDMPRQSASFTKFELAARLLIALLVYLVARDLRSSGKWARAWSRITSLGQIGIFLGYVLSLFALERVIVYAGIRFNVADLVASRPPAPAPVLTWSRVLLGSRQAWQNDAGFLLVNCFITPWLHYWICLIRRRRQLDRELEALDQALERLSPSRESFATAPDAGQTKLRSQLWLILRVLLGAREPAKRRELAKRIRPQAVASWVGIGVAGAYVGWAVESCLTGAFDVPGRPLVAPLWLIPLVDCGSFLAQRSRQLQTDDEWIAAWQATKPLAGIPWILKSTAKNLVGHLLLASLILTLAGFPPIDMLGRAGSFSVAPHGMWLALFVGIFLTFVANIPFAPKAHLIEDPVRRILRQFENLVVEGDYSSLEKILRPETGTDDALPFVGDDTARVSSLVAKLALQARLEFSGDEAAIDRAIELVRGTADLWVQRSSRLHGLRRLQDGASRFQVLDSLAEVLWLRYERLHSLTALDEAISVRRAMRDIRAALPRISSNDRAKNAVGLAMLRGARFELTHDRTDLREGLRLAHAVTRWQRDRESLGKTLLVLGDLASRWFSWERGQLLEDRDNSTANTDTRAALAGALAAYHCGALFEGDGRRCEFKRGVLLVDASRFLGDSSYMSEGLEILQKAVDSPESDPIDEIRELNALGRALEAASVENPALTARALTAFEAASEVAGAPVRLRLEAACNWGYCAQRSGNAVEAARGLKKAVELLPRMAWIGLDPQAQNRLLARHPELAVDAAAFQIAAGDVQGAVELLEMGRVVLWSQQLGLRTAPLERLTDSKIIEELSAIRAELDTPVWQNESTDSPIDQLNRAAERRTQLSRRWSDAMEAHGLLQAQGYQQLRSAAADGPVVIVNASKYRCDAIVIRSDHPATFLELPGSVYTRAWAVANSGRRAAKAYGRLREARAMLRDAGTAEEEHEALDAFVEADGAWRRATAAKALLERKMLRWLWTDVARPVLQLLDAEGALTPDGDQLPRVWWCPTGCMTFLPVHAAGLEGTPRASVMDRVVSSYTPTLSQLIHAREPLSGPRRSDQGMLVVAPTSDLANADKEAEQVSSKFADVLKLEGDEASAAAVREQLLKFRWLHFVGHGAAGEHDSRTGAVLEGGLQVSGTNGPEFLSARMLSRMPAIDGEFAYLSVCDAASPDAALLDEAAHPAAVLHFNGFRHVIATLNPLLDNEDAPRKIIDDVYARLVNDGRLGAAQAARALHHAVNRFRARDGRHGTWATYIHVGP